MYEAPREVWLRNVSCTGFYKIKTLYVTKHGSALPVFCNNAGNVFESFAGVTSCLSPFPFARTLKILEVKKIKMTLGSTFFVR